MGLLSKPISWLGPLAGGFLVGTPSAAAFQAPLPGSDAEANRQVRSNLRSSTYGRSEPLKAALETAAAPVGASSSFALASFAGAAAIGAAVAAGRRTKSGKSYVPCRATPEEWTSRVKAVAGERCLFDVTIPKPLGLTPRDFPARPGVGIAAIAEGGNTDLLNRRVLIDDEPGMWVLEGDEVVAVDGTPVEGKGLDEVGPLVKNSKGDSITLTLCRAYNEGPVKVLFIPSEKMATMKRGSEIRNAAKVGVAELSYSCQEGWCKSCWQTCDMWDTVYRACSSQSPKRPPPKNPRTVPEEWNNIIPLKLISWPETVRRAKERKKAEKKKKTEQAA